MGLDRAPFVLSLVLGFSPPPAPQPPNLEGAWQTWDDRTGSPRALVRISVRDGRLFGVIERLFLREGEDAEPICPLCPGERRGQRIRGMEILRGHRRDENRWTGGSVLDPENGKEYSGWNELTIGFGSSVLGTCIAYALGQRLALRSSREGCTRAPS